MSITKPIYLLADDLTGAADAANYFCDDFHLVRVALSATNPWDFSLGPNIVQVCNTESRHVPVEQARRDVFHAANLLRKKRGADLRVYKKIDSTLRGNVGIEIEALLAGLGRTQAIVAPTFVALGRTVHNGILFVNGSPLSRTAVAGDPRTPVTVERISQVLQQTSRLPVYEIGLDVVRQGPYAIQENMSAHQSQSVFVADCVTDEDLNILAGAIAEREDVLPCGAAGFAQALAPRWLSEKSEFSLQADKTIQRGHHHRCSRVLVLVGSANTRSARQVDVLLQTLPGQIISLEPQQLAEGAQWEQALQHAMVEKLDPSCLYVVVAINNTGGLFNQEPAIRFEDVLAQVAMRLLSGPLSTQRHEVGFVATGGDTATALCRALQTKSIWPMGEVATGMPWSRLQSLDVDRWLVTKAGGFGQDDALVQAVQFLLEGR